MNDSFEHSGETLEITIIYSIDKSEKVEMKNGEFHIFNVTVTGGSEQSYERQLLFDKNTKAYYLSNEDENGFYPIKAVGKKQEDIRIQSANFNDQIINFTYLDNDSELSRQTSSNEEGNNQSEEENKTEESEQKNDEENRLWMEEKKLKDENGEWMQLTNSDDSVQFVWMMKNERAEGKEKNGCWVEIKINDEDGREFILIDENEEDWAWVVRQDKWLIEQDKNENHDEEIDEDEENENDDEINEKDEQENQVSENEKNQTNHFWMYEKRLKGEKGEWMQLIDSDNEIQLIWMMKEERKDEKQKKSGQWVEIKIDNQTKKECVYIINKEEEKKYGNGVIRQNPKKIRFNTRLDSLARILEARFTCASIFIIGQIMYVTTNAAHISDRVKGKEGKGRSDVNYLIQFMTNFLKTKGSSLEALMGDDPNFKEDVLDLLLQNYKGKKAAAEKQAVKFPITDEEVKQAIELLLTNIEYWNYENKDYEKFNSVSCIKDKREKFKQIGKFRNLFEELYRDVRDFKNICRYFNKKGLHAIEDCRVIAIEGEKVHTEMRSLSYLLRKHFFMKDDKFTLDRDIYFGISKLCCPKCRKTLLNTNEKLIQNSEHFITFRGSHKFNKDTWARPSFLQGENSSRKITLYKEDQEKISKYWKSEEFDAVEEIMDLKEQIENEEFVFGQKEIEILREFSTENKDEKLTEKFASFFVYSCANKKWLDVDYAEIADDILRLLESKEGEESISKKLKVDDRGEDHMVPSPSDSSEDSEKIFKKKFPNNKKQELRDKAEEQVYNIFSSEGEFGDKKENKNICNKTYWYESDVLQAILPKRCDQLPELKLAQGKRFLRTGKNEAGTFACDRYPNQTFYVAIGDATDVGNEKARFQNNEGKVNENVSYGIDFLSLMGASDNVVYTVCETLFTHINFSQWSVQDCREMFFNECQKTHRLETDEIQRMQIYQALGGDGFALYSFGDRKDFEKIAEIEKTEWEKIEEYDEKLFHKIQQVKNQGKAYESLLLNSQETKFLKQLLKNTNQNELSNKLPDCCQSIQEAQQVLTTAWQSHRVPTVFSEVLPLIVAKESTVRQARVVLPLNVRNGHWISLEIVLFYDPKAKQLKADIWQHDPYGGNGETLDLKTYEAGKFQQQLQLVLREEMALLKIELNQNNPIEIAFQKSPYEKRQQDGSSCGAITIEDIVLLAQGESLNNRLFPVGAPKLRQGHQQIYNQLQQNNTQTGNQPKQQSNNKENLKGNLVRNRNICFSIIKSYLKNNEVIDKKVIELLMPAIEQAKQKSQLFEFQVKGSNLKSRELVQHYLKNYANDDENELPVEFSKTAEYIWDHLSIHPEKLSTKIDDKQENEQESSEHFSLVYSQPKSNQNNKQTKKNLPQQGQINIDGDVFKPN